MHMRKGRPARSIVVSAQTRCELERLSRSSAKSYRASLRACIILLVDDGFGNDDGVKHARFRKDTVHLWILEIADHRNRLERTALRDTIENLRVALVEEFPWVLEKIV